MTKIKFILSILLVSVLLLSGCSGAGTDTAVPDTAAAPETTLPEAEPPADGLLRFGITEAADTMDIHKTTKFYLLPLNIYERLFDIHVREDGSTELAPSLASEYTISEDGRTYSFTLREDAFFSDGTPVKASDVAFTFTRMLALPESEQADFADMILGADAVLSGKSDTLAGIRVLDDTHLTITLSEPFAGYIYQLATPSCSILSEAFVTKAGDAFGSSPETTLGSGPYMVKEASRDRVLLTQNPYYREKTISVKEVEIRVLPPALMDHLFQEGDLDLLDTANINPDTIQTVYKSTAWKNRLISKNCVETHYLMLNVQMQPLDDVLIRRAVQMAIDRQKILDTLYNGDGILVDGIYPKGLIGYSEENQGWLSYDPEGAKALIARAGLPPYCTIELAADSQSNFRDVEMLQMISDDLEAVGLPVSIVSYDTESRMYLRKAGKLMAYTGKWIADYNDPDNFIYTFFGSTDKTRGRSGNFSDQAIMERIYEARTIQDEALRLSEYAELEKILVQDNAVWVPLFSMNNLYVLGERVESFIPYWAGLNFISFKDVVLK